jgi:6-phosphogluconolactonase (cycloisomerase 2 family)
MKHSTAGVYVQTNNVERNEVVAFRRDADGELAQLGVFATGGTGDGVPHLTSQGSVVLTRDGTHLLVTNAASDDLSLFAVTNEGLELRDRVKTGGTAPKSVTEHAGLVYALNAGSSSLAGFRIESGRLIPVDGSHRDLSAPGADGAQVSFIPDGSALVVTERGTDSIVLFRVAADGRLGEPEAHPSSGQTPYGFAFTSGGTLVVTEAFGAQTGKAAASSYRVGERAVVPVTRSAGNGLSEICWAVVTKDDRYAFTTNFADGKISRYRIRTDGSLELDDAAAAVTVENTAGVRDEDLSADGRFLYAVDADARRIFGYAVGEDGSLEPIGSWDGLPATVAGLAAS